MANTYSGLKEPLKCISLSVFPTSAPDGTIAVDLTTHLLYMYNQATSTWIPAGGGADSSFTCTKAVADTGYTCTALDHTVFVNTVGGDTTINLPTATGIDGRIYVFKKVNAANNMVIAGGGSNIDGDASKTYAANYSSITVQSDGTNWYII